MHRCGTGRVLRGRRSLCNFDGAFCAGGVEPLPYGVSDNFTFLRYVAANLRLPNGRTGSSAPTGRCAFSPMVRANLRLHPAGSMWASTPTNVVRIRIGASVFAGAYRRADRVVRPYGYIPFRIGAHRFATSCRAGGVEPRPYANLMVLRIWRDFCAIYACALRCSMAAPIMPASLPSWAGTSAPCAAW